MGVRGLCKFIDENPHLSKAYELHNTRVVIDGANIAHYLLKTVDCTLGGNYDEYADTVKEYFSSFIKCHITPLIIFDGGNEVSDRKFDKLVERQEHRLMKVKSLIENCEVPDIVLPIIAFEVFKDVLSELGISFAQCDYEGDNQMAALANEYRCPVLSDDSDFYIFDLHHGFIRLSHIDTCVKTRRSPNGSKQNYLVCNIYYINTLLQYYPLADRNILYLISALAGNDYVSYDDFKHFYFKMKIYHKGKFSKLFAWLRNHTLKQAIKQVLQLCEINRRQRIESLIECSVDDYKLIPNNLRDILESVELNTNQQLVTNSKIITLCGKALPAQFVVAFHRGLISTSLLNIITHHRKLMSPQVENFCYISSYVCSRYIRQVTYGILLQHETKQSVNHKIKCLRHIEEYDRVNDDLRKINVKFLIQLKDGQHVPRLADAYRMGKIRLRKFITDVLDIEESFFADIPNNLQLLFGCIIFWLRNSSPRPTKQFLDALLLCIIYYQVKETLTQGRTVTLSGAKAYKDNSKSKSSLTQNISNNNVRLMFTNIGKHLDEAVLQPHNPWDIEIVHCYSQLQSCVFDIVTLNALLCFPFKPPQIHNTVSGILLHNLTEDLMLSSNTEVFVKRLLCNAENINVFNTLKFKVLDTIPRNFFKKKL